MGFPAVIAAGKLVAPYVVKYGPTVMKVCKDYGPAALDA
jgi:hypothetical protein